MDYPQRNAVLFALRELTGQDAGPATAEWLRLFPSAETDAEAARLGTILLNARPSRQEELIREARDAAGEVHERTLAFAIPLLREPLNDRARTALIQRFTRLSPEELRKHFSAADSELRRCAILASARKDAKELTADLIGLAEADDPLTAVSAVEALKAKTEEKFDDPAAWRKWWNKQSVAPASGD
jgi:hypothetical protein